MPELPEPDNRTVEAIYATYEAANTDPFRDHLGASLIGTECERSLFYTFRWATKPNFPPRVLRLFQTGFREEARIIDELRSIGIEVYDRNPETGKQIQYSSFGNHFAGSLDGIALGFVEAPATWHVLELKTSNDRNFKVLKSKGVKVAKFLHWCQIQTYMFWAGLDRAMYIAVNKNSDDLYQERVYFDKEAAEHLEAKAYRVIFANEPGYQAGGSDKDMKCRFCQHVDLCRGRCLPEVNCRTCAFADVIEDGKWKCARSGKEILPLSQRNGCPIHIYIPKLVCLKQVDADNEAGTITYEGGIVNGKGATASKDLWKVIEEMKKE
jgi:hypothetical protein